MSRAFPPGGALRLTADVEQVCKEEGLLVEVLYGEDDGSIQATSESLLGAALVCDERLKHGTDHVQLEKERRSGEGGACFHFLSSLFFFFSLLLKRTV